MEREIKFRAWNGGKMRENKEALRLLYNNSSDCEIFHTESIFMQFTGLTDKNGKEIYEGDVLKWKSSNPFSLGEIRIVSVTYTQAQFWCNGVGNMFGKFGVYLAELLTNERCEVIGNIYEHQNLLK